MENINWIIKNDGVIYFDNDTLKLSYYIYPANYNENKDVQLHITSNDGHVLSAANYYSLEEAKQFAITHMKAK